MMQLAVSGAGVDDFQDVVVQVAEKTELKSIARFLRHFEQGDSMKRGGLLEEKTNAWKTHGVEGFANRFHETICRDRVHVGESRKPYLYTRGDVFSHPPFMGAGAISSDSQNANQPCAIESDIAPVGKLKQRKEIPKGDHLNSSG